MTLLCLSAGTLAVAIAAQSFTLAWTHSVEKLPWEEDWRVGPAGLELLEARVRGGGAGMEAPEGARYAAGVWHYRPELPPLKSLTLAESGAVPAWRLCLAGECRTLESWLAGPLPEGRATLTACAGAAGD